jgi:hypothetical protein
MLLLSTGAVVNLKRSIDKVVRKDIMSTQMPSFCSPLPKQSRPNGPLLAICCRTLGGDVFDVKDGADLLSQESRLLSYAKLRVARALFCSPPCTLFSSLMNTNWPRMSLAKRRARASDGLELVQLSFWYCDLMDSAGRPYCFEAPHRARSIGLDYATALRSRGYLACFDQCQFGLVCPKGIPIRKRTYFLTNSRKIWERFDGVYCDGKHDHVRCEGKLTKWSEVYPAGLAQEVLASLA